MTMQRYSKYIYARKFSCKKRTFLPSFSDSAEVLAYFAYLFWQKRGILFYLLQNCRPRVFSRAAAYRLPCREAANRGQLWQHLS